MRQQPIYLRASDLVADTKSTKELHILLHQRFKFPSPAVGSNIALFDPLKASNGRAEILNDPQASYIKFINFLWLNDRKRLRDAVFELEESPVLEQVREALDLMRGGFQPLPKVARGHDEGERKRKKAQLLNAFLELLYSQIMQKLPEYFGPDDVNEALKDPSSDYGGEVFSDALEGPPVDEFDESDTITEDDFLHFESSLRIPEPAPYKRSPKTRTASLSSTSSTLDDASIFSAVEHNTPLSSPQNSFRGKVDSHLPPAIEKSKQVSQSQDSILKRAQPEDYLQLPKDVGRGFSNESSGLAASPNPHNLRVNIMRQVSEHEQAHIWRNIYNEPSGSTRRRISTPLPIQPQSLSSYAATPPQPANNTVNRRRLSTPLPIQPPDLNDYAATPTNSTVNSGEGIVRSPRSEISKIGTRDSESPLEESFQELGISEASNALEDVPPGELWSKIQREKWKKTVNITGNLEFDLSQPEFPFVLKVNPLSTEPLSNRFWRKFGSDRFMTVRLPPAPKCQEHLIPLHLKKFCVSPPIRKVSAEVFHKCLVEYLFRDEGIEILGRVWKGFWIKTVKDTGSGKQDRSDFQGILFAVKGEGINASKECEIEDLLDWHIPLEGRNLQSTVPKLWSRLGLGFTKTTSTVYFTTDQICPDPLRPRKHGDPYTPDPEKKNKVGGKEGGVMNDGCSIASPAVFRRVQQMLGLKEAPTAIQGRLGGAKGLWIVDPTYLQGVAEGTADPDALWIRVNDSQAKYQEHQGPDPDIAWTTLDLHSFSGPPKPATVNLQLLAVLDNRGVPFEPLCELVDEHLNELIQELYDAIEDPVHLRNWVFREGNVLPERVNAKINYCGAFPGSPAERILECLDSGFRPQSQNYLMKELRLVIDGFWGKLREKLHIRIPQSTSIYCVADPTGTLKPGEVSLHFSRGIEDKRTGRWRNFIEGDILVARVPAHLPSDVQKVRAVNNEHLRELKDVIVFSTQGMRSLAGMLSGGDYDGDRCWICWDQRIVGPFRDEGSEVKEFANERRWFTKDTTRVNQLELAPPLTAPKKARIARSFLRAGALSILNSEPDQVGRYSKIHQRYSTRRGLDDDLSIELAHLCAALLDAPKQGMSLRKYHKAMRLAKFRQKSYMDSEVEGYRDERDCQETIIERLQAFAKVKVAEKEAAFRRRQADVPSSDSDLTEMFQTEEERANQSGDVEIKKCLRRLKGDLKKVLDKWSTLADRRPHRRQSSSQPGGLQLSQSTVDGGAGGDQAGFSELVNNCYMDYLQIKPLPDGQTTSHPVIKRWAEDADKPNSEWQLLKASCSFYRFGGYSAVWYWAGHQLCYLKARASTDARYVVHDIYQSLKTERRFLKAREDDIQAAGRDAPNDEGY